MQDYWSVSDFLSQYDSINTMKSYRSHLVKFFTLIYPELENIKDYESKIENLNEYSIKYFTEDRDIRKDIILYKDSLKDSPPKSRLAKLSC